MTGTVSDGSGHGWPLYAQIRVPGTPVAAYTSPVTGAYRITLPTGPSGTSYRLDVSAQYPGYRASATTVHLGTAGAQRNIGLKVDPLSCTAPGYRPAYHGYREDFNSGTRPAGWTVINAPGTLPREGWVFDNPHHLRNYTGGSGGFAVADALNTVGTLSTVLTTPVINMSGDTAPVLRFKQDASLNDVDENFTTIDVSTDGGHTWSQVAINYLSVPGPDTVLVPLPQAAGQSRVQVRFRLNDELSSWELDDVFLGDLGCQPAAGGLVVGQVRDHNTG